MPKAEKSPTTHIRGMSATVPTGPVAPFAAAMGALRDLTCASTPARNLAGGGGPDAELVAIADRILEIDAECAAIWREIEVLPRSDQYDAQKARDALLTARRSEHQRLTKSLSKIAASTGAGLFAKARVLRHAFRGAPRLSESLALDLLNVPAFRAALWPACSAPSAGGEV